MVASSKRRRFPGARAVRHGAARTDMGSIGLQLATECPLMPSCGRKAKVPGGHTFAIAGYVLLPFEVAGVKKEICVVVLADETLE